MKRKRTQKTRRALVASLVSMALCCALLLGTTFAWFTDSVTNAGNVITAGNLKIDAVAYDVGAGGVSVTIPEVNNGKPFSFESDGLDLKSEEAKTTPIISEEAWEPGKSDARLLEITNSGNLAANIRLSFDVSDNKLQDALWFDFVRLGEDNALDGRFEKRPMRDLQTLAAATTVLLEPKQNVRFVLVYGMKEEAGNIYQGKSFSAGVTVMATQAPVEEDGFGNSQYDAAADGTPDHTEWAVGGTAQVSKPADGWAETTTVAVPGARILVPQTAIADGAGALEFRVVPKSEQDSNVQISVAAGERAAYYEISVSGLRADNQEDIPVELQLDKNLENVRLYHYSQEIQDAAYIAETGILTFKTKSFSPFTVLWDNPQAITTAEDLMAAMAKGGEYFLGADIETAELPSVPQGVTMVLDLNGYTFESKHDGYGLENKGNLTINDSKGTGIVCHTGTETASNYGHDAIRNFGVLTINGGTFGDCDVDRTNANPDNRGASVRNQEGGVCTINGGYFTCGDNYWQWGTDRGFSYAIRNMGDMTISGGTLYGAMNGGVSSEETGETTITGGNFSVTGSTSYYVLVTGGLGTITVTGGNFTKTGGNGGLLGGFSGMPSWDASGDLENNGYFIQGGTFVQDGETVTF